MPAYVCDVCGDLPGEFMVSNTETGKTDAMCSGCYGLIGLTIFLAGDVAYIDGVLAAKGYQPSAAEKKARVAAAAPEVDPNRTIATIVEDQPRPPDAESTSPQGDPVTSGSVDNGAGSPVGDDHASDPEAPPALTPQVSADGAADGGPPPPY